MQENGTPAKQSLFYVKLDVISSQMPDGILYFQKVALVQLHKAMIIRTLGSRRSFYMPFSAGIKER